jgi:hypothetical protein
MSKISNYEELVTERRRLENELLLKKSVLNAEIDNLKRKIDPILNIMSFFTNLNAKSNRPSLLKIGTSVGIDVMRQTVLSKAGWLTKLLLPMVLKGVSSKVIDSVQKS